MTNPQGRRKRRDPTINWPTADREAWILGNAEPGDFTEVVSPAPHWRDRTRRNAENYYHAWLKWVRHHRADLLELAPSDRVTREAAKAYAKSLRERGLKPRSVASSLGNLAMAMSAIAPRTDWRWLFRAGRYLSSKAPEPDFVATIPSSAVLLQIGEHWMGQSVETGPNRKRIDQAVMYRDGLMIALLALVPIRRGNLAALHFGTSVQLHGETWKIVLPPEITKTGQPFEAFWPPLLLDALRVYLTDHRCVLLPDGSQETAVWASKQKGALDRQSITSIVSTRTKACIGVTISPQKFRHAAATTIAEADPEGVTAIAGVLGHSSVRTSEKHYNKAAIGRAFERHGAVIRPARRGRTSSTPFQLSLFDQLPADGPSRAGTGPHV